MLFYLKRDLWRPLCLRGAGPAHMRGSEDKRLMGATVDGRPTETIIIMNRLLLFFSPFDVNDIS